MGEFVVVFLEESKFKTSMLAVLKVQTKLFFKNTKN
jgi:hypothetical protein